MTTVTVSSKSPVSLVSFGVMLNAAVVLPSAGSSISSEAKAAVTKSLSVCTASFTVPVPEFFSFTGVGAVSASTVNSPRFTVLSVIVSSAASIFGSF